MYLAYVGIQSGQRHANLGPILPVASEEDLQEWIECLRGQNLTEEQIAEVWNKNASMYVKIELQWAADI